MTPDVLEPDTVTATAPASALRLRRLRRTEALRTMFAETDLSHRHLVLPLFVREGTGEERAIHSMPGHAQRSVDRLASEVDEAFALGIPAVLLFGIPSAKDETGGGAWSATGPVPRAIAAIKRQNPDAVVVADVCMCEYTSHGHCGVLSETGDTVDNDATLPLLGRAAVAYADAGADIVAPSAMMDSQVTAIRTALDDAGHQHVAIMSYAVKFASAFYGPFRDAAGSTPAFGDRRAYQMDPPNVREAMREAEQDVAEGADILMVKPAGPYLDVIRAARERFHSPLAAYQVSGEYAMLKAASERGWLDERRAAMESLLGIRRAGADLIITYFAKDAARWLADGR
ncbi:MAG TPA: porphobilinogen synthase [Gemmatimonadaceae bacterium]|nr:porphobilinogen synthase [Gemmatimonadaceae bacterium]